MKIQFKSIQAKWPSQGNPARCSKTGTRGMQVDVDPIHADRHRVALQKKYQVMLVRARELLPTDHWFVEILEREAANPAPSSVTFTPDHKPVFGWKRSAWSSS